MDKQAQVGTAAPQHPPARSKQFDTRILDRMEAYCVLYRHWLQGDRGMPRDYAEKQREAYRRRLIESGLTLLVALDYTE